jgi:hypothetical protein
MSVKFGLSFTKRTHIVAEVCEQRTEEEHVTRGSRHQRNEEFQCFYSLPNILRTINSKKDKMDATFSTHSETRAGSCKTFATTYQTTRCHSPKATTEESCTTIRNFTHAYICVFRSVLHNKHRLFS